MSAPLHQNKNLIRVSVNSQTCELLQWLGKQWEEKCASLQIKASINRGNGFLQKWVIWRWEHKLFHYVAEPKQSWLYNRSHICKPSVLAALPRVRPRKGWQYLYLYQRRGRISGTATLPHLLLQSALGAGFQGQGRGSVSRRASALASLCIFTLSKWISVHVCRQHWPVQSNPIWELTNITLTKKNDNNKKYSISV